MVTGQPPFPGKDVELVLRAHLEQELTPPDHLNQKLSSGLGEVVEWLMAKSRKQRYKDAEDLIIDLECLLAGEPPKLARQRIQAGTLQGLAEGETADEENHAPEQPPMPWVWLGALAGLLAISLLFNLILMLRGRGQ
jgi:serine/threonine-protein kinase